MTFILRTCYSWHYAQRLKLRKETQSPSGLKEQRTWFRETADPGKLGKNSRKESQNGVSQNLWITLPMCVADPWTMHVQCRFGTAQLKIKESNKFELHQQDKVNCLLKQTNKNQYPFKENNNVQSLYNITFIMSKIQYKITLRKKNQDGELLFNWYRVSCVKT